MMTIQRALPHTNNIQRENTMQHALLLLPGCNHRTCVLLTLVQALEEIIDRQATEVLAILVQNRSAQDVGAAQSLRGWRSTVTSRVAKTAAHFDAWS